jgi:MFS family permease
MRPDRLPRPLAQFLDYYRSLGLLRDRRLALLAGANLLDSASTSIVVPLLPLYAETLGVGPTYLGLLFAVPPLCRALGSTPMGYLADRLGRRPFLVGGTAASAVGVAGLALTTDPTAWLALRAVDGVGSAMRDPPTTAYIGDVADGDERGQAIGAYQTAGMLAVAVGPALGGGLAEVGSLRLPFLVLGAATLVGAALLAFLPPVPGGVDAEFSLPGLDGVRGSLSLPVAVLAASGFAGVLGTAAMNPIFAPLLELTVGGGPGYVGLVWTCLGIGLVLFVPVGGTLADERGRVRTLVAGKLLWAVVMVGLAVGTAAVLPPVLLFLGGVASAFSGPSLGALRYELAPEGEESTLLGFFGGVAAAGGVVGPLAGGWVAGLVGIRTTAVLVGLLWLLDAVGLRVGVPEPER